jgi:hypothetical protein
MKIFKQSTLLLIGFLLLAVTSCKKTNVVVPATKNSRANDVQMVTSSHLLYQYHSVKEIDLTDPKYYEYNSCAGDKIHILKGIWHIEVNHIYNGVLESIQFHTNTSDYRLVDLTTGIEYTGSYASNDIFNIDASTQALQDMGTLTVLLTTPGGDNNSKLIADYHFKVDAEGNLTLDIDNMRAGCQ